MKSYKMRDRMRKEEIEILLSAHSPTHLRLATYNQEAGSCMYRWWMSNFQGLVIVSGKRCIRRR